MQAPSTEQYKQYMCTLEVQRTPADKAMYGSLADSGPVGPRQVSPKVENAVRAVLCTDTVGGFKLYAPADKAQNVPMMVANGPERLVCIGLYNHGREILQPICAKQTSTLALQGVRYRDLSKVLMQMSWVDAGLSHGVLVWFDDKYLTRAYVPMHVLYTAVQEVQRRQFQRLCKQYSKPTNTN